MLVKKLFDMRHTILEELVVGGRRCEDGIDDVHNHFILSKCRFIPFTIFNPLMACNNQMHPHLYPILDIQIKDPYLQIREQED
jgi:hypothetical protein